MGSARIFAANEVRALALLALAILTIACNQSSGTALGSVTAVEGSIAEITSFTVLSGGVELEFLPVEGISYGFALPHLREHILTGEKVVVGWELRNDLRYALTVEDGQ